MIQTAVIVFASTFCVPGANAQDLPIWQPQLGMVHDFGPRTVQLYARRDELLVRERSGLNDTERQELDSLLQLHDEADESPYDVIGIGCSWYCGGGPDSIWATSEQSSIMDLVFDAQNAHDLDYGTMWASGGVRHGIGETLFYRFAPESPRINSIRISNGAVLDTARWKELGRVKKLLLRENDVPLAIMVVEDTPADQFFATPLLGRRADGTAMVLSFEIVDIHPGTVNSGVAITELWFDGVDVH